MYFFHNHLKFLGLSDARLPPLLVLHRIVQPLLLGRGVTVPLVDGAVAVVEQFCVSLISIRRRRCAVLCCGDHSLEHDGLGNYNTATFAGNHRCCLGYLENAALEVD